MACGIFIFMLACLKNISFEGHPSLKVKHGRKSRLLSFDRTLVELANEIKKACFQEVATRGVL